MTCNLIMAATNFFDYINSGYTISYGIKSLTYLGFAIIIFLSKVLITIVQCYKDIMDKLDENNIEYPHMHLESIFIGDDVSVDIDPKEKENSDE